MSKDEKINVLFIDDEEEWREYAMEGLDGGRSSCITVNTIARASEELNKQDQKFDYLIMDWGIGFPGQDGPQSSKELALSAKLAGITVIVMTGHLLPETMEVLANKKIPYYQKSNFPEVIERIKK